MHQPVNLSYMHFSYVFNRANGIFLNFTMLIIKTSVIAKGGDGYMRAFILLSSSELEELP